MFGYYMDTEEVTGLVIEEKEQKNSTIFQQEKVCSSVGRAEDAHE